MSAYRIWISFVTIINKEITRFTRIWMQTLLPPVITMSLYYVIFGHVMGRLISDFGNYSYIEYIAPGLIMMSVLMNSYNNVVSSFFGSKFGKSLEELLVSPTPNIIILLGFTLGGMCRGILVGIAVTLVTLFFTKLHIHNLAVTILVVVMSSMLFALAGFINAIYARKFDDISIIPTFILTPLIYLGGVFYSIDLLPEIWQNISLFNPILYIISSFRYGMLGIADIEISHAFYMLLLMIAILFGVCMFLLNRGTGTRT
jgi:ABC-2 type transport system permease protein